MSEVQALMAAEGVRLLAFDGVHEPDAYSAFLLITMRNQAESPFLDLCCGSSFFGIVMARRGLCVTAVDISAAAVEASKLNARENGLDMRVLQGDLFGPVADQHFISIAATPPVMPTPTESASLSGWYHTANDGGPDGRVVYDRILMSAKNYLLPGGCLWLLHPWFLSIRKTSRIASAFDLYVQCVASRLFPMGNLSGKRLMYISSLGFTPERNSDGRLMQRMCVVRITDGYSGHSVKVKADYR